MTAIEHRELKGITVKNLVVTVMSTASIVASVMTTYFGLRTDIREIKQSQETETRINNIRIKLLEDNARLLQKEVDDLRNQQPAQRPSAGIKTSAQPLFSMIGQR